MTIYRMPEGVDFETWSRVFIVLPDGEIKRFSKSRYDRIHEASFTGRKVLRPGDPFKDEELIKYRGKRYARMAMLIVTSLTTHPIAYSDWSDNEITPEGIIKADLWARTYGRPWEPTKEQFDYMLADALNKKPRRPSIKQTPEDERFEFN